MKKTCIILFAIAFLLAFLVCCEKEEDFNPGFPSAEFIADGKYEGEYWPTEQWKTCKPEEVGMDSETLREMNEEIVLLLKLHFDVHNVLIIRKRYIVAEQYYSEDYGRDSLHRVYSCTKSIISATMGIAMEEGYISGVETPVLGFFPEYSIEYPEGKEDITLKHMLTMSAGFDWHETDFHYSDEQNTYNSWVTSSDRIKFLLDRPLSDIPGSRFNYNTGISHVLSAVIQKQTGIRTDSFAVNRLFNPLGISDYYWHIDPNGIANGGSGIWLKPRDLAKIGLLYLNMGRWEQNQVIPDDWVAESLDKHILRGDIPDFYYGYQWWIHPYGLCAAVGYAGQVLMLIPELELIIVFNNNFNESDSSQLETPWRLLDNYIIPSVRQ
ncbi:MAG: serine hydrolase [Bacteroidales bacterium]|nr:MAG: serine hydrolase [Bacteroidales bacterium]